MRVRIWALALGFMLAVGLVILARPCFGPAEAARRVWSVPKEVSTGPDGSSAEWPSVVATGASTVTVVWQDDRGVKSDIYFAVSGDGGRSWPVQDGAVYTSTWQDLEPKVASGADDMVHLAWVESTTGTAKVLYSHMVSDSWCSPMAIFTGTAAFSPDPAVDSGGKVHVVWAVPGQVYYRFFDGVGWSSTYTLPVDPGYIPTGQAVAADGGGVHIVWSEEKGAVAGSRIRYKAADGGGVETISSTDEKTPILSHPDIACDGEGNLHVIWCEYRDYNDQQVWYRERAYGGGWGTTQVIPGSRMGVYGLKPTYIFPKIAARGTEGPFVVWQGRSDPSYPAEDIHFAERVEGNWVSGGVIQWSPYVRDLNPDIAVDSEGAIHLVWQRDQGGAYQIYHCYSLNRRIMLPLIMKRKQG